MLNARLFAGLAAVTLAVEILGWLGMLPPANLDFLVGGVGFGPPYWRLVIFFVCTFFGFAYFGIARLRQRPLNRTTGLVGFLLVAFASIVWLISSFLITLNSRLGDRLAMLLFAAVGCFVLGVVLATANVGWALLRRKEIAVSAYEIGPNS